MEQQYSTQLQNFWSGQTAEAGATTDDNSNASNAIDNLQPSNNSQTNRTLNDEDLQRRIDILRQEASSVRARSHFTDRLTHETYRIQAQLQRAEHERSRRAGPVPVFGTREEVERQGPAYQSPLTSLFRQQMPSQNAVSDTGHQHSNGAAAGSHHTPASNPWLNPSVTETQRGSSGGERVEARRHHSDVAAGQSGAPPNGLTDPSHLNTSTAFLHHLRTQNTLQQRYQSTDQNDASRPIWRPGNRTGDTFASATPPQNYFSSSNLGHELEGAQEDAYGTGIRRIPNHRRHPGHGVSSPASPQATSGTNDGTSFEELFFRMHAPPSSIQPRPLTSQQSFEREAAHRAAALRQYREIDEFHIRQVRFMQEQRERDQRPAPSLDNDTTRPEPLSEDAKMVKMECKICFGQATAACANGVAINFSLEPLETALALLIVPPFAPCVAGRLRLLYVLDLDE
ncbi:MAG: hypothetical protein Q9202_001781 [Teloschistes flavicans]